MKIVGTRHVPLVGYFFKIKCDCGTEKEYNTSVVSSKCGCGRRIVLRQVMDDGMQDRTRGVRGDAYTLKYSRVRAAGISHPKERKSL